MTNIVNVKIDLDDPNSWTNAEVMLRNLANFNDNAKRAGVEPTPVQMLQIVQIANDRMPSVPVGDIPTISLSTPIADSKKDL